MIQVYAAFGSTLGQWISMPAWQRITLVAGGAGGGIAASFNTPIGGILFAVEIVVHELSVRTLVPVAISTVTATYVSRLVFGDYPSFIIPELQIADVRASPVDPGSATSRWESSWAGCGAVHQIPLRLRGILRPPRACRLLCPPRRRDAPHRRHVLRDVARLFGHYYIEGVGYATVQDLLTGSLSVPLLLCSVR